jgi:hypothetical protein
VPAGQGDEVARIEGVFESALATVFGFATHKKEGPFIRRVAYAAAEERES